jgi:subtilisin-like proprotein convertase family protein
LTVQLVNNGGAIAKTVTARLSSNTSGVTVTTADAAFDPINPGAAAAGKTPFVFSVSPSVPCGSRITFFLSVSFTGTGISPRSFTFPIDIGTVGSPVVTPYSGGPVAIPDGNATGVNVPLTLSGLGRLSSLSFHIDGTTCTATQGATTVGISHSWVGDLSLTLTSPSGTKITLMDRPGGITNSGNNFCQTVLSDAAVNSIQDIAISGAPWQGSFKPATPLSAFAGEDPNGTWVLHATDSVTIDTGTVRAFSLETTPFACTP